MLSAITIVSRPGPKNCPGYRSAKIICVLLAMAISGCASFWLLYPGMAESNDPHIDPGKSGHSYEVVSVTNAQQNRLTGWLFSATGDYGTALVAGGNAQNLSSTYNLGKYLIGNNFRMFIFTYQGFDANGGSADLNSLVGDAHAFYSYAKRTYGAEPISFVGYSTGAVTGLCLGDTEPLAAMVAEGSF